MLKAFEDKVLAVLVRDFCDEYFEIDEHVRRPRAPRRVVAYAFIIECIVASVTLAAIFSVTFTKTAPVTYTGGKDMFNKYIVQGYQCAVLSQLRGIRSMDNISSENAQFTGSSLNYSACVEYLTVNKVCDETNIFKYISVTGISPTTDYVVGNFLYTPNSTMQLPQIDNAIAASISMVLPDGSLVITTNNNQVDARIKTKLLFGDSPSFPIPSVPLIDQPIKKDTVQFSPTGGKNMMVLFKEGKIQARLKLMNEGGRCLYPEAPYHQKCFGSPTLALDLHDNSIWVQYAGNVGMIRIDTSKRIKKVGDPLNYLSTHRYSTAPYALTQNSNFAVDNGTVWMINFPGNTEAFGTKNGTFGTSPYYADFNNDVVINQYYANQYYAEPSKPKLAQISMKTGKIEHFELTYSCPKAPLDRNSRYQIYYDSVFESISVVQMCMNQEFERAFSTIHYFYLFKKVKGKPELAKAVVVDWRGSMFFSGQNSLYGIEIYWRGPETYFAMTPGYGFLWCSDRRELPQNYVGSAPYMFFQPRSDLLFLNGNSNLMAVNTTSRKTNQVDYWYSTNYMIVYTFGICNSRLFRGLINISAFSDFSSYCTEKDGFYYQSPNRWYVTPSSCALYQPDQLMTKCPGVKQNFDRLVSQTCEVAVQKLCKMQYTDNPPFSCSSVQSPDPVELMGSALANANAVWGGVTLVILAIFSFVFPEYADNLSKEEVVKRESQQLEMKNVLSFLMKYSEEAPARRRAEYLARLEEMILEDQNIIDEENVEDLGILDLAALGAELIDDIEMPNSSFGENKKSKSNVSDTSVQGVRDAFAAARTAYQSGSGRGSSEI